MRMLGEGAFVLSMLAVSACSDRHTAREDTGHAAMPLGPVEAGWRLPPTGDLNYDGLQDVIWRNLDTNRMNVALMNGTGLLAQGPEIPGPPGDGWTLTTARGDFDLDGMADLLWYNAATNRLSVWLMRGTEPRERGPELPGPPGDGWMCVPALDYNLDGMEDLLWYNPVTNRLSVWLMRGTEPFERGPEIPGPPGGGWLASFGGRFDRSGMSGIFWINAASNRTAIWLMRGTGVIATGPEIPGPPGAGWIIAAAGDFNFDQVSDALWFNTRTRRMTVSLMFGTGLLSQGPEIPAPPGPDWIVGSAGDVDGDGMSDTIWLNSNPPRLSVWLMNGTLPVIRGPEIPGPSSGRDGG